MLNKYESELAVSDKKQGDEVRQAVDEAACEAVRSGPGFKKRVFEILREAITQVRRVGGSDKLIEMYYNDDPTRRRLTSAAEVLKEAWCKGKVLLARPGAAYPPMGGPWRADPG